MNDLNRGQLIGHLGHDPEVAYTATGTARTTFSMAISARWKDADGRVQEIIEWSRCVAWGAGRGLRPVCHQGRPRLRGRATPYPALAGCRDRRTPCPR